MRINNQFLKLHKILSWILFLVIFIITFQQGGLHAAHAQPSASNDFSQATLNGPIPESVGGYILSNGQFVYGPNIGDFNLKEYLQVSAPHLLVYADDLYGRSEYFSINPKIYLTLLELHSHVISAPNAALMEDSFGLNNGDFIDQIEYISNKMSEAYYLHLYTYSPVPVSQRNLTPLVTSGGAMINVAPNTNAGTYAIIAGLSAIDEQNISLIIDNNQAEGFYQTYRRLFNNDDPLDETNHITIPGEVSALAAPNSLLQFPWLQGQSWYFGGVHSNGSGGSGTPYINAAALDFGPGGVSWGSDTSAMWVVASASGTPTKTSNCGFKILHGGGWETGYYHIENIQNFSGTINQNDKIGVIANTLAEATCAGGNASGPHVHFYLSHNGALTAINGTSLSGWYVHAGRWEYDTDCNYMWFEKAGTKKCPNINKVLSEAPPLPPTVGSSIRDITSPNLLNVKFIVTFSESVTGVDINDFTLTTSGVSGATVGGVSGSGSIYTVTVNTGTGNGTVRLNIVDNDSIVDISNNPLGGTGAANGNFTSGETFTITKNLNTYIGGELDGSYFLNAGASARDSYTGLNNGPVRIQNVNSADFATSVRVLYGSSYSDMMGFPGDQLSKEFWFPIYDMVNVHSQVRVGNLGIQDTTISVYIGNNVLLDTYTLPAGQALRKIYNGNNDGPLHIVSSTTNILATVRLLYQSLSFSEVMGLPNSQLTTEYWFPWYNNTGFTSELRVANAGSQQTSVTVYIGDNQVLDTFNLDAGTSLRKSYTDINNGPLRVISSTTNILTSVSILLNPIAGQISQSYSEMLGFPGNQLTSEYIYPAYDAVSTGAQLRVSNVGAQSTTITVYIGNNQQLDTYTLAAGAALRKIYPGYDTGPLRVVSSATNILTTLRTVITTPTYQSYYELTGYPVNQLTSDYWFPWYNNVAMDTQFRIALP